MTCVKTFRTVGSDIFCCPIKAVRHRTARRLWPEARPEIVGATAKQQIEALAIRGGKLSGSASPLHLLAAKVLSQSPDASTSPPAGNLVASISAWVLGVAKNLEVLSALLHEFTQATPGLQAGPHGGVAGGVRPRLRISLYPIPAP
jgi:energy-converting hydrogenase Eha subunit B